MLEHIQTSRKWFLTNSTSTISALETLRYEFYKNANTFDDLEYLQSLIKSYLPIFNVNLQQKNDLIYQNKYLIKNNDDSDHLK